jgi:glycosyltransferase involved in cell wall biosynthesis
LTIAMPNSSVIVSVIIPCYNYARFLPDAVASVLAQTFTDWELIVVDDGSTDATLMTARQLMARHSDRRIRVFRQPNSGPAAARNTGAKRATGTYLLFLDADDILAPPLLERTMAILRAQPAVGFVYSGMRLFGQDRHEWPSVAFDLPRLALDNYVLPHALVRRAAWEQVGGFDPARSLWGFEDWDFWLRVATSGWRGWHIAEPLVFYRRHGHSLSDGVQRAYAWDVRAQLICKHPRLYSRRLAAWATIRCARHSLPTPPPLALRASDVREFGRLESVVNDDAPPLECVHISLARRLLRAVPFELRYRVQCWRRRGQLGLRAAFPWFYL